MNSRLCDPSDYGLERPERLPFAVKLELAALIHDEDMIDTLIEAYYARIPPYEPLPLLDEQVAFMVKHHGEIVRANFYPDLESLTSPGTWEPKILGDVLITARFSSGHWTDVLGRSIRPLRRCAGL